MTLGLSEVLQSKTPKIYKDKRLNNAHFSDFNHNDYQVFLHLITKIGGALLILIGIAQILGLWTDLMISLRSLITDFAPVI